jgi:hypothetical protein
MNKKFVYQVGNNKNVTVSVIGYYNYPLLLTANILTLVTNVSLHVRKISCKVPARYICLILIKFCFLDRFCYTLLPHYKISRNSVNLEPRSPLRTHWWTHRLNEANSEFCNFVKAPQKAITLSLACSNFQNIPQKKFNPLYFDGFELEMSVLKS